MPSLSDFLYDTAARVGNRISSFATDPVGTFKSTVNDLNTQAGQYNQALAESVREPLTGPKTLAIAEQMAGAYNPVGMTVYHGSPYKFMKFDPSKIGTGEGAQAFGHGLYVAQNPEVAGQYAKNVKDLGSIQEYNAKLNRLSKIMDEDNAGAYRKFKSDKGKKAAEEYDNLLEEKYQKIRNPGNIYKIDLPDEHIEKMLDWDKPLSEQHPYVQKAIKKTKSLLPSNAIDDLGGDLSLLYGKDVTPENFLNTWESLTGTVGSGEAALAKHGVMGVKYLDENSRNIALNPYYQLIRKSDNSVYTQMQDLDKAKQFVNNAKNQGVDFEISKPIDKRTRNFVIFPGNEDILKIQDINGNPIN